VAAAQEERSPARNTTPVIPRQAVDFCLRQAGTPLAGVDRVVFYDKPFLKFGKRLLETYLAIRSRGVARSAWPCPCGFGKKLFQRELPRRGLAPSGPRASRRNACCSGQSFESRRQPFYPSRSTSRDLTMDGVGEWGPPPRWDRRGADIRLTRRFTSLTPSGLLYSGRHLLHRFQVNSAEYKVMGWLPMERPGTCRNLRQPGGREARRLVPPQSGFLRLLHRPDHDQRESSTSCSAVPRASRMSRSPGGTWTGRIRAKSPRGNRLRSRARWPPKPYWEPLPGGGVALNASPTDASSRRRLSRTSGYSRPRETREALWGRPCPLTMPRRPTRVFQVGGFHAGRLSWPRLPPDRNRNAPPGRRRPVSRLGRREPAFHLRGGADLRRRPGLVSREEWNSARERWARAPSSPTRDLPRPSLCSISKSKFRESFRPFAPSVLRERVADWFELDGDSPYMLLVANVREIIVSP